MRITKIAVPNDIDECGNPIDNYFLPPSNILVVLEDGIFVGFEKNPVQYGTKPQKQHKTPAK